VSASFRSTQWSLVIAAARWPSPDAQQALAALCTIYWPPLYAFVRRCGYSTSDAEDLTQEFFARLLEKNFLKSAEQERGRFRSFLLASMKHFLANEWDRAHAKKRGGDFTHVPIDVERIESLVAQQWSSNISPEQLFERQWALTVIELALARLEDEFSRANKRPLFDELKSHLLGPGDRVPYANLAFKTQTTVAAIKVTMHRMRRRFRDLLRSQIGQTVASEAEIDDEIRYLMSVVGS